MSHVLICTTLRLNIPVFILRFRTCEMKSRPLPKKQFQVKQTAISNRTRRPACNTDSFRFLYNKNSTGPPRVLHHRPGNRLQPRAVDTEALFSGCHSDPGDTHNVTRERLKRWTLGSHVQVEPGAVGFAVLKKHLVYPQCNAAATQHPYRLIFLFF